MLTSGDEGGILGKRLSETRWAAGSQKQKTNGNSKKVLDKAAKVCYTEAPVTRQAVYLVN